MFEGNFTNPADLTGILIIMIECLCLYRFGIALS